ncbi:hypothetical protein TSAR_005461 [Trichomalopsis sarcophagae]|uniref:Uncharacterized protein n=1 Tax=Trichomalopsis sarcophagae TaxID=543379 RepID=A0A232ER48_9HYME|nr:hypothetical protein TSAR_005461 [Trichomalopsis sarcophagae]
MSRPDLQALRELRAERDLLHLLLAKANRALILERHQHRKSSTADVATQTEPTSGRQHTTPTPPVPMASVAVDLTTSD